MARISFGAPQTLVSQIAQWLPEGSMHPVWGLATLQFHRPTVGGPSYVAIVGANTYNNEVISVPLIQLAPDGGSVTRVTLLGEVNYPSYAGPMFVNLNNDGLFDVVLPGNAAHNPFDAIGGEPVRLALSTPAGGFQQVIADPGRNYMHSWDVGDIDRDGMADILVMNTGLTEHLARPTVLRNLGDGLFERRPDLLPAGHLESSFLACKLADLNNDGWLDAVMPETVEWLFVDPDSDYLQTTPGIGFRNVPGEVWLNDGTGHLVFSTTLPEARPATQDLDFSTAVTTLDVNSDGWLDIIYAASAYDPRTGRYSEFYSDALLTILINDTKGGYIDESASRVVDDGVVVPDTYAARIEVQDVNLDGHVDLVVFATRSEDPENRDQYAQSFAYYLNDGAGHFTPGHVLLSDAFSRSYTLGDVNGDGVLDVMFAVDVAEQDDFIPDPRVPSGWAGAGRVMVSYGSIVDDQWVSGTSGRDALRGGDGHDTIEGGDGIDAALYAGLRSNYSIERGATGVTVAHKYSTEGTDTLLDVERIRFSDVNVALDVEGHAGQAYRLYQAAFDRAPDLPGLGFQMKALDDGWGLSDISQNFIDSPEFTRTYGALNDAEFVTQLYANVLHRAPEADGLAYHVERLQWVPRSFVLVGFSESPENKAAVIGVIENGMVYTT